MATATPAKKLEQRLVLHGWITKMLGFEKTNDLLDFMQDCDEDIVGRHTRFHERLLTRNSHLAIDPDDLADYDDNIRAHVEDINNATTAEPIKLRYFQYLALLYTEIVLDWLTNHPAELIQRLNEYAEGLESEPIRFAEADLDKLAFWMATGSGKTLIMNINLRQFLHYDKGKLDNIILVTPNEGLSDQHIREMRRFGTLCERFSPDSSGDCSLSGGKQAVKVTEITKLTENKKGSGVSVDVESFEGRNLVFVDEGHKGSAANLDASKEKAWRTRRNQIAEGGFTFEYSATFGQALSASKNDELAEEYGKAILFDYSYRYFHKDEYGKDFKILNLKTQQDSREKTDLLLLGNLLSFYEQRRYYARHDKELADYMIEPPLWIFVGSSVNAVYTKNKEKRSDVLTVVSFLHRFLRNERGWAEKAIEKVFGGQTGLVDDDDVDVFSDRFGYLKSEAASSSAGLNPAEVYVRVLEEVFHAGTGGGLHVASIKGSAGELGLKVAGANDYFGLVYIGDTSNFKNLLESEAPEIVVEEDAFSPSLFDGVNDRDSRINILIGAKKFIEGWSSWRVSTMGLLNIGKTEGSQIIQLFGRGVRLKGKDFSMKRSSAKTSLGETNGHPSRLDLLETLGIFAVEANYMAQFKEYLWREDIDPDGYIELPLPIQCEDEFLKKGLLVPQVPEGQKFVDNCPLLLEVEDKITVPLNLSTKAETTTMASKGLAVQTAGAGETRRISDTYLAMMDWPGIYLDLVEHKNTKGYRNLIIPRDAPRSIMQNERLMYKLTAERSLVEPTNFAGLGRLREIVLSILRKYVDKFYSVYEQRWDSERMVLEELQGDHANFSDYVVKLGKSDTKRIQEVKNLIAQATRIYNEEVESLPNIHFDRHLFQPLLLDKEGVKSSPEGLNDSEIAFVKELRSYCLKRGAGSSSEDGDADTEIFLLRNHSKKGVGFYYTAGFYPDFILWVKKGDEQRIVFIEPHGMRQEDAPDTNEKIRLYRRLQELSEKLGKDSRWKNISLDSYIVSPTSYNEMADKWSGNWKPEDFFAEHIVFEEHLGARILEVVEGSG